MQKWEYMIIEVYTYATEITRMNQLGEEGWELVAIVPKESGSWSKFIFKRPLS